MDNNFNNIFNEIFGGNNVKFDNNYDNVIDYDKEKVEKLYSFAKENFACNIKLYKMKSRKYRIIKFNGDVIFESSDLIESKAKFIKLIMQKD